MTIRTVVVKERPVSVVRDQAHLGANRLLTFADIYEKWYDFKTSRNRKLAEPTIKNYQTACYAHSPRLPAFPTKLDYRTVSVRQSHGIILLKISIKITGGLLPSVTGNDTIEKSKDAYAYLADYNAGHKVQEHVALTALPTL